MPERPGSEAPREQRDQQRGEPAARMMPARSPAVAVAPDRVEERQDPAMNGHGGVASTTEPNAVCTTSTAISAALARRARRGAARAPARPSGGRPPPQSYGGRRRIRRPSSASTTIAAPPEEGDHDVDLSGSTARMRATSFRSCSRATHGNREAGRRHRPPRRPGVILEEDSGALRDRRLRRHEIAVEADAAGPSAGSLPAMADWTATTTTEATPEQLLEVLTHPEEIRRWSPVDFDLDELDAVPAHRRHPRTGDRQGRRRRWGSTLRSTPPTRRVLELSADGPIGLDVRYELAPEAGSDSTRPSRSGVAAASPAGSSSERHRRAALGRRAGRRDEPDRPGRRERSRLRPCSLIQQHQRRAPCTTTQHWSLRSPPPRRA